MPSLEVELKVSVEPSSSVPKENAKSDKKNPPQRERPQWSNSTEFLMSCISSSVGLGNIWRFPFTAYENGGGAFLIPYVIILFIIGKPMYYLEMILGQFSSRSSVKVYELCPALRGVGLGQMVANVCIITYYCSLISMTLYYMFASFSTELPWSRCLQSWGADCVDSMPSNLLQNPTMTSPANGTVSRGTSSSELYFLKEVIKETNDISNGVGAPNWKLVLCLLASWVIIFLVIIRGVKSSGKAAYFLALFPYVIILALLVRAVTLEGASKGIIFFITPQWNELLNPMVWKEAIVQLFFSLGVGLGPIIMFASYNRFDHNIYRDAMIVTSLDTFTSMISGITIFGILGNLAHNLNIDDIGDVVKSGTGLAFISYPDAISKFDFVPQIFSVLFFFMLFVLGIGSVVAMQNVVATVFCDQFKTIAYWKVALVTSVLGFLSGIVYLTPGGQWILNLIDHFGGTLLIFALAMLELTAIFYIYGLENFCWDLEFMTGRSPTVYWRICWSVISPIFMLIIFMYTMINLKPLKYSGWEYPDLVTGIGWLIFGFGIIQIPLWGLVTVLAKRDLPLWNGTKACFKASHKWRPVDDDKYTEWIEFKRKSLEQRKLDSANHSMLKQKLYILLGKYHRHSPE